MGDSQLNCLCQHHESDHKHRKVHKVHLKSECKKAKKRRACKKFKPHKIPRYLPGQVKRYVLLNDLHEYNIHRCQVFHALPRVDSKPPLVNPNIRRVRMQNLLKDSRRVSEIYKQNKAMAKRIKNINKNGGFVDSFNPFVYDYKSNRERHEQIKRKYDIENEKMYKIISKAKAAKNFDELWEKTITKLHVSSTFPFDLTNKKNLDSIVQDQRSISHGIDRVDARPKCFMDFRVKNGMYLGRIIIELYNDYVPLTVKNFVSICCDNTHGLSYKNCYVHKVAPGLYIETGDILKGNGKGGASVYGNTFAEENPTLKHSRMGVLSMVPVKSKANRFQFSITLTAMKSFDDTRVAFGKVIIGNSTLCKINDLGKKFGTAAVSIQINKCGKFIKGKTATVVKNFKYTKGY